MSADNPAPTPVDAPAVDPSLDEVALEAKDNQVVIDAVSSGPDDQVRKDSLFGVTELPEGAAEQIKTAGSGVLGAMLGVEAELYEARKAPTNVVETTTGTGPDDRVRLMDASVNSNGVLVDSAGRPLPEADVIARGLLDSDAVKAYETSKAGGSEIDEAAEPSVPQGEYKILEPAKKITGVDLTTEQMQGMKDTLLNASKELAAMQTDVNLDRIPEPKPTTQAQ